MARPDSPLDHVCGVTVTYGARSDLLSKMVAACEATGLPELVVIGNGVSAGYEKEILALAGNTALKISYRALPRNSGSAGGFHAGIEQVLEKSAAAFIWLLDDDALPRPDALTKLCGAYDRHSARVTNDRLGLFSLRSNRPQFVAMAQANALSPAAAPFGRPHGFHALGTMKRLTKRILNRTSSSPATFGGTEKGAESCKPPLQDLLIPAAPYCGLFFHRDLVQKIGLPDKDLLLYADDLEFSARINDGGGQLFLVPASVIDDAEASWHLEQNQGSIFEALLQAPSEFRIYYSTRNQAYMASRRPADRWIFFLNSVCLLAILLVRAVMTGRVARFRMILQAFLDGFRGRLGENLDFPLPQ